MNLENHATLQENRLDMLGKLQKEMVIISNHYNVTMAEWRALKSMINVEELVIV